MFGIYCIILYLCSRIIIETIMCTVNIKINEAVLRSVLPELDSTAAINRWAQLVIDQHIDALTQKHALNRDMTPDELYNIIAEEIDSIYAAG